MTSFVDGQTLTAALLNGAFAQYLPSGGVSTFSQIMLSNSSAATWLTSLGLPSAAPGSALGLATLDAGGHVPLSQVPASLQGAMTYQGLWNASTNSPTLVSGVGTKGFVYKVSVAGTTTIDGNSSWNVGDQIVFNGATWDKWDGISTEVISVAGRVGAVTLSSTDITDSTAEGRSLLTAASAAAARTALGLGSVATLTAGTGANNAVQLNSSSQLPAVDGSLLTNVLASGGLLNVQIFASHGTFTYTPTTGCNKIIVIVTGSGGSGGGSQTTSTGNASIGSGGGSGSTTIAYLISNPGSVTVVVAQGGAGSAGTSANGASSSFNSTIIGLGGGGGSLIGNTPLAGPNMVNGGAGAGLGSGGTLMLAGQEGYAALLATIGTPGSGGASFWGGAGPVPIGIGGNGLSPGSGGSGATSGSATAGRAGGNGADGIVAIFEYR